MRERYDSATREVDMECYQCLSEREREEYFGEDISGRAGRCERE